MSEVKGYKVFNPDWTCRGFKYAVDQIFEENVKPVCCESGFHFCLNLSDCFSYYRFKPENKVAEVIAIGDIDQRENDTKTCTNKIKIVREISWQEVLAIVNTGKSCTGLMNTGNRNTGDWNTGDMNTGDWNTGNWNTGDMNTGDMNTGNRNTGNRNTGNWNTGDWNTTNFSSGCFNTEEPKIMLFNKPSYWTYRQWLKSGAHYLLNQIPNNVVEWICEEEMTSKEKEENPTYKTTRGYLKVLDESESAQTWWDGLSEDDRDVIRNIPNFDQAIFEKITKIKC